MRYEAAGLVFTDSVENRVWRSLRLSPERTGIRLLQSPGRSCPWFPDLPFPIDLEGHSSQVVELRMEMPADAPRATPAPPRATDLDRLIGEVLRDIDGFELIDAAKGVRLQFPRGW